MNYPPPLIRIAFVLLLVTSGCNNPESLMQRGNLAHRSGHVAEALQFYKAAANSKATEHAANYNLGRVYLEQGQYELSVSAFEKARPLEIGHPLLGFYRSKALLGLGRSTEAEAELEKCVKLHPGMGLAWLELAKLRASKEDYVGAIQAATRSKVHPGVAEESSTLIAGWHHQQGNLPAAILELEALVKSHAFAVQHRFSLGFYLLEASDFREAERRFRDALTLAPGHAQGLLGLGHSLVGQGRVSEARDTYESLVSNERHDPVLIREAQKAIDNLRALEK